METKIEPTTYPSPDTSIINLDPIKEIKKIGNAYAKIMHRIEPDSDKEREGKFYPTCLVCILKDVKGVSDVICLNVRDMYRNAIDLVLMLANKLVAMNVSLKTIEVSDKSTFHLLKDFCKKTGIKLKLEEEESVDDELKGLLLETVYCSKED